MPGRAQPFPDTRAAINQMIPNLFFMSDVFVQHSPGLMPISDVNTVTKAF
jgi:hypothetical protein